MEQKKSFIRGRWHVIAALILFFSFSFHIDTHSRYHPVSKFKLAENSHLQSSCDVMGYQQCWFNSVKDQGSGQLDVVEMLRMQQLSNETFTAVRNSNPSTASTVQWTEIGPDNVGGRTRAILFDNLDPNHQHMFAAGVSGGIFESTDAGNNWQRCSGFFSTPGVVITVTTLAQAPNGDLYAGTGEGSFYNLYGTGAGGYTGGGIYKSTDDGITWNVLSSTQPSNPNNNTVPWIAVNKIACDPVNSNIIYAGMNKGFRKSTDGGITWSTPTGIPTSILSTDVAVASNGNVIAIVGAKPRLSTDGGLTFTNVGTASSGFTNDVLGRTTVAIAPSDPNYVYCFCADVFGALYGVYVSVNGGFSWTQVCGAGNAQFDPFASGVSFQGTFDNIVTVDPSNPNRAIFGGVQLWEWIMITNNPIAGQWTRIATEFPEGPLNQTYVGEDKHAIVFQPGNPEVFYIGCDRGIFRTPDNGQTYVPINRGFNVTQCYAVAFDHLSINRNVVLIGTQDNGTQFIDGTGSTTMSARKISYNDNGNNCAISFLNPNAFFRTLEYGYLYRSSDYGLTFTDAYSSSIHSMANFGVAGFANFITPISLWESANDTLSGDSILLLNNRMQRYLSITNGDSAHYAGTISINSPISNPSGTIVLDSIIFIAGSDTIHSDMAGNLYGNGTGTVFSNGNYSLLFNTVPPPNLIIKAFFYLRFAAGTIFTVNSNIFGKTLNYTSTVIVNPNDTLKIQDVLQSHLAVGFTSDKGVWITRRAIDFFNSPSWIKIGGLQSVPNSFVGETSCLAWSADGNYLFVGTSNGAVYRFSNVGMVTDTLNGNVAVGNNPNPNCVVTCTLVGNFASRYVTALDVNPNNADKVIVSLGNYNNFQYVYYSGNATTATGTTGTFTNKTGNLESLGGCPAFSISFDKYVNNRVLVGTEHGIFETTNLSNVYPTWVSAMNGLDNVSVNQIIQQRFDPWLVTNSGCFYIATHGRGVWRDDSSWQMPTGISDPSNNSHNNSTSDTDLKVFPNPVTDNSRLQFKLAREGDVTLQIFDLNGKLISTCHYEKLMVGINTIDLKTEEFAQGTYIIVVNQNEKRVGVGRFIKMD